MLPVSGAEQLNTSGAQWTRPMISHSGAYSRFVSPAPYSLSGRKRFHNPAARAFGFSSSMIGDQPPTFVFLDLSLEALLVRVDVLVHESAELALECLDFVGEFEIHWL